MKKTHCICLDLTFNDEIKHYLPTAYIALEDKNVAGYIEKRAALDTLKSYGIIVTNDVIKLLDMCNSLKIEELHKNTTQKQSKKGFEGISKRQSFCKSFESICFVQVEYFL